MHPGAEAAHGWRVLLALFTSLTSRGEMQQLYADVRAMDLGRWPADGKALVKKVGRTLDKLKSTVEINRILRASNEYFRA